MLIKHLHYVKRMEQTHEFRQVFIKKQRDLLNILIMRNSVTELDVEHSEKMVMQNLRAIANDLKKEKVIKSPERHNYQYFPRSSDKNNSAMHSPNLKEDNKLEFETFKERMRQSYHRPPF